MSVAHKEFNRNSHKLKCTAVFGRNVNTRCATQAKLPPRNCGTLYFKDIPLCSWHRE